MRCSCLASIVRWVFGWPGGCCAWVDRQLYLYEELGCNRRTSAKPGRENNRSLVTGSGQPRSRAQPQSTETNTNREQLTFPLLIRRHKLRLNQSTIRYMGMLIHSRHITKRHKVSALSAAAISRISPIRSNSALENNNWKWKLGHYWWLWEITFNYSNVKVLHT